MLHRKLKGAFPRITLAPIALGLSPSHKWTAGPASMIHWARPALAKRKTMQKKNNARRGSCMAERLNAQANKFWRRAAIGFPVALGLIDFKRLFNIIIL